MQTLLLTKTNPSIRLLVFIGSLINRIEEIGGEYEGEFAQLDIWFDNPALRLKDRGAGLRLRREEKFGE